MDDQLDNGLKNRIKEVFEHIEDPSPSEGWLLLREKFPEEGAVRRPFAWIWWGAAAVLLLFVGIGLWIKSTKEAPKNNIVKTVKHLQHENPAGKKIQKDSIDNIAVNKSNTPSKGTKANAVYAHRSPLFMPLPKQANHAIASVPDLSSKNPTDTVERAFVAKNNSDSVKTIAGKAALPQLASNSAPKSNNTESVVIKEKKPEKSIIAMFNDDKDVKAAKSEDAQKSKRIHFGVYAATYFNYAKGSDNQVNVGAGLTSDIKLNKNLKLVTGIAIAQNSLSYQGFPTATASAKSNLYAPATAANTSTFTALSTPTVKNYNASLVGLDVPINLKYEFNPEKSDAYISAGFSSGTFIDESYTYKYNYPSLLSPTLQQPQNETTGKSFNSFYFAKTLNVAFGVGYPFGKNRLIIEPFLKYPLDGMGAQNLRFGAGGLNLKFNFVSPHK